ncbi:MAG: hypothetical protein E3J96_02665 [Sulfurovum sp.]|nr:MAG: hypothetical protein E3J96_02665 [Sulfurovum sp.]
MKKSFKLFIDSLDILDDLTDEQAGQLFKAIRAYEADGVETLGGLLRAVFNPFKTNSDRAKIAYKNVVERNKANGLKGGRPKTQDNPVGLLITQDNPKKADKDKDKDKDKIREVVEHLNLICGTKYKITTEATIASISGRLSDGYSVDDFKTVHKIKFDEWNGTDMSKHLTPSTLYRPSNFEKYLNQQQAEQEQVGGVTW